MSYNPRQPSSSNAKPQKLFLFPGDPLIKTLKPDYYVIVAPNSFQESGVVSGDNGGEEPPGPPPGELGPPNLEDITLVSKKLITDKDNSQYVEFIFNIKNHVGDEVVGVMGYGK